MDRLHAMSIFADVAETESFTATAERLDLSKAMVTRAVSQLEQWLGARLLHRTTRRVTLTDAGEQCLSRARQMLALQADLEEETTPAVDGQLRGQLRLTTATSFAHAHLAAALAEFLSAHPLLRIDLDTAERALNLVEARVDLALRIASAPDPSLMGRPLAPVLSKLVAAPAYLEQMGVPQHPNQLMQHHCLGHAHIGRNEWVLKREGEVCRVQISARMTANEATVLMEGTRAGGGIAMLPTYLVSPSLVNGKLVEVLPGWELPTLTLYGLYASRRQQSPALRQLLDFLVARFADPGWRAKVLLM